MLITQEAECLLSFREVLFQASDAVLSPEFKFFRIKFIFVGREPFVITRSAPADRDPVLAAGGWIHHEAVGEFPVHVRLSAALGTG